MAQLNVEYNQLDPLLREGEGAGDVNDPDTGFSPYPGNINQLVFALDPYSKVCTTYPLLTQTTKALTPARFVGWYYVAVSRRCLPYGQSVFGTGRLC